MSLVRLSIGVALFAAIVGWWLAVPAWLDFLTTIGLAKGLAILGVVLLLRAGLVSFGQGLFFAAGAYAAGFAVKYWAVNEALLQLGLGLAAGTAVALLTGLLVARYREIFFAMLTLAFSMMLFGVLVKFNATTGGSDGLPVPPPTFFGVDVSHARGVFLLTLATTAIVVLVADLYATAPLGHVARALRDNEIRVGYLGASVQRAVLMTFVLAGASAGLGGALEAMAVGHIDPNLTYWTTSGEFVFVALLAGSGSVVAPVVGSVAFEIARSYALKWFPDLWQIVLGAGLLTVVLLLPGGLWSLYDRAAGRARAFGRRDTVPAEA